MSAMPRPDRLCAERHQVGDRDRRRHDGRRHLQPIFLTDWANYAAINGVYAKFFPGDKPARYCIQCGLVKKEALVEIATVAHVGKK